ncbi:MAG TPA: ATP-binding cassette domain-containing protein [Nitriliruptorales bacterium]
MDIGFTLLGFEVTLPVITLGAIFGMTYGILAVGLVLVYRQNRIINFAHGEVGAFSAATLGVMVTKFGVPYWLMFPVGMALSAGIGALAEVAVIRRLRHAPKLMSIVATLGVGQILSVFALVINAQSVSGTLFPKPPWLPEFGVGVLNVTSAHSGMLLLTPVLVIALVLFLRWHPIGKAMRGSSANPAAARLSGIFASRMSTLAWAIAGGISAFTAILFTPTATIVTTSSFGPSLLLRALAAAVIGRMTNLPLALGAGVGLGVIEQLLLWNNPSGGAVEAMIFVIIVVALLLQRRGATSTRDEERGSWTAVQAWRRLPEAYDQLVSVRALRRMAVIGSLALVVLLPTFTSNANAITFTAIIAFTIVGLSIVVVTGLGGQLTLGQFALAGIGALASIWFTTNVAGFEFGFIVSGLAAAAASLVLGFPALRIRGLMLTVTTLSFGLMVPAWLLQQSWAFGSGVNPGRPIIPYFGIGELASAKHYYYFALFWFLVAWVFARNVRRGGIGRRLVAVRDNEDNARAFTVNATAVKLQAFVLSGFLAGIGGSVFAHTFSRVGNGTFPVSASIDIAVMAVVGGLGILAGPLLGALLVIAVPEFIPLDNLGLFAQKVGLLLLILYLPGGLAQGFEPLRMRVVRFLARRAGLDPAEVEADVDLAVDAAGTDVAVLGSERLTVPRTESVDVPDGAPILSTQGLRKHFGGVRAVDGVDIEVNRGEIVGLIGPNGAGKTTLFELLGGFTEPDEGRVVYAGQDVTGLSPEARGRLGLVRSFQDAGLFPTMTVIETVQLAFERAQPTRLWKGLLGLQRDERDKEESARAIVHAMGLDRYRNKQIQELSTGTRRITEIACLTALQPTVLLLDEPSSGIAQRETEVLGSLLREIKRRFDLTLVIIEHDIPLIMGLADRIVAMDTGRVIAVGEPDEVAQHPEVVESYLGGDMTAIYRSGQAPPAAGVAPADEPGQPSDELKAFLAGVPGLGPVKQERLLDAFGSLGALAAADVTDLTEVEGIGPALAGRVSEAAGTAVRERAVAGPS